MKSKKLKKKRIAALILVVVLVCIGVFLLFDNTGNAQPSIDELMNSGVFAEGITVDGTAIGGLPYAQGKEQMQPTADQMAEEFSLTVKLESNSHKVKSEDINLATSLDQQLQEAIKIGNIGNRKQRREAKRETKRNGKNYELDYTYDQTLLEQNLDAIYEQTGQAAKDATVKLEGGKPVYTPGKNGKAINMEKLQADVNAVIHRRT